jgi:hypothetical protein
MKAYLIVTGSLFGLLGLLHVWRAIAEWPRPINDHWFALLMLVTIILPTALSLWAWWLVYKFTQPADASGDQ